MIQFDESICRNLDLATRREWLETNGIGGFASSTIVGMNTRRYHGLLVAATKPPTGRMVLLSKLEETLLIEGRPIDLSCNRYPGVVHPQGFQYMKEFRRDPFPRFVYEAGGVTIEKSVFLLQGENTVVAEYAASQPCILELRPLIAFRDYHSLTHENLVLNPKAAISPGLVVCEPYVGLPKLHLAHTAGQAAESGYWYHNFEYPAERERGFEHHEDLFNPFVLRLELAPSRPAAVVASTSRYSVSDVDLLRAEETKRRLAIWQAAPHNDPMVEMLTESAAQFVVKRGRGATVIAGYPWFTDWGRDALIALPGLTLVPGRYEEARAILRTFSATMDHGMLPNRFPDAGEAPEYNSVDAALWLFEAARAFAAYTG